MLSFKQFLENRLLVGKANYQPGWYKFPDNTYGYFLGGRGQITPNGIIFDLARNRGARPRNKEGNIIKVPEQEMANLVFMGSQENLTPEDINSIRTSYKNKFNHPFGFNN